MAGDRPYLRDGSAHFKKTTDFLMAKIVEMQSLGIVHFGRVDAEQFTGARERSAIASVE